MAAASSAMRAGEADRLKSEGTERYKEREFNAALQLYDSAAALDPKNMVYALNKGAVHLEVKDYAECIAACNEAVSLGKAQLREAVRSPNQLSIEPEKLFGMIKKAYLRMGRAHMLSGCTQAADVAIAKATEFGEQLNRLKGAGSLQSWARLGPGPMPPTIADDKPTVDSDLSQEVSVTEDTDHGNEADPAMPGQPLPTAGTLVELSGLSTGRYNGARGRVIAATADGTRLIVQLVETSKEIRVKPSNTIVLERANAEQSSHAPKANSNDLDHDATNGNAMRELSNGMAVVLQFSCQDPDNIRENVDGQEAVVTNANPDDDGRVLVRITSNGAAKGKDVLVKPAHLLVQPLQNTANDVPSSETMPTPTETSTVVQGTDSTVTNATTSNDVANDNSSTGAGPQRLLQSAQVVKLHGLKTVRYNGLRGEVLDWIRTSDRYLIRVTAEGAWKGKELLLKETNLAVVGADEPELSAASSSTSDEAPAPSEPAAEPVVKPPPPEPKPQPAPPVNPVQDEAKKFDAEEISFEALLQQFKDEDAMRCGEKGAHRAASITEGDQADGAESKPKRKKKKKKSKAPVDGNESSATGVGSHHGAAQGASTASISTLNNVKDDGTAGSRAKLIRARREEMMQKEREDKLSLQDVADYEIFVQGLVKSMEADKQLISRKYRMAEAKLKISRDPKRIQSLSTEIDNLKRRERRFNDDVAVVNQEVDTFHASPAFKMARKHVLENFVEQGGTWVNKKTLEEDQVDFEKLLQQLKLEDGAPGVSLLGASASALSAPLGPDYTNGGCNTGSAASSGIR